MNRVRYLPIVATLGMIAGVFWVASATRAAEKRPDTKKKPKTWIQVKGSVFGAKPDKRGPIGGGKGYAQVVTGGDFTVKTLDELVAALAKAKAGQVVFVDGRAEIDCTERVPADKLVIEVPAGVTLASDRGHKGSRGALIFSDWFATLPLIRAGGKGVRVTGIRLRGPDPKRRMAHHGRAFAGGRGSKYYYSFPISGGIDTRFADLRVDNCEMSGWSHAAINLRAGAGPNMAALR